MDFVIPHFIERIESAFPKDCELSLVGGCVRDTILGKTPKDYDLVTNLKPDEIISVLEENNIPCDLIGKAFGIIFATIDRNTVEIATYRKDIDGHRETNVSFDADRKSDAERRDFTINQIYYDLRSNEIIDHFGGMNDLDNSILRCVGSAAKRIEEDPLRVYRAFRFANALYLKFDDELEKALRSFNGNSHFISNERVANELQKIFFEGNGFVPLYCEVMQPIFDQFCARSEYLYREGLSQKPFVDFIANLSAAEVNYEKMLDVAKFSNLFVNTCKVLSVLHKVEKGQIKSEIAIPKIVHNNFKIEKKFLFYFAAAECYSKHNAFYKFLFFNPIIPSGECLMEKGLKGVQIGNAIKQAIAEQWEIIK